METIALSDLAPILATMLGPMLVFAVAIMRYQHLDSAKTRELIDRNREASDAAHKETRELIDRNHRELSGSLGDARERLSRVEGYLRASPPPGTVSDGDAEAA